jgi:hypothetical protein
MLVLIHVNKEQTTWIEANSAQAGAEPPVPPIEWCTRSSGGGSDHVVVLYDLERLVKELLPQFAIAPTSVPSFVRKLCRWGFRQVSAVYGCVRKNFSNRPHTSHMYESQHFRCGNFALLTRMNSDTAEKRRYEASIAAVGEGLGADTGDEPPRVESRASPVQSTTDRNLTSRLSGPTERKRPRSDEGSHRAGTSPEFRGPQNRGARAHDVMAHPPAAPEVKSLTSVHQLMNQYPLAPTPVGASRLLMGTGLGAATSLGVGEAALAQGSLYGSSQQQEQLSARHAVGNHVYIAEQGGVVPNYQRVGLGTVQSAEFSGAQHGAAHSHGVMVHPPAAPDVTSLTSVHQLMNQYLLAPTPVGASRLLMGTGLGAAASLGVGAADFAQGSLYGSLQQQEQLSARHAVGNHVYIAEQGGVVPNYQPVGLGTVQFSGPPRFHVLQVSSTAGAQQNAWMVPAAAGAQQNAWMFPTTQSQVGVPLSQYHLSLAIPEVNLNAHIRSPPQLVMPQLMIGQGRRELTIQELMLLLQSAPAPPYHPR